MGAKVPRAAPLTLSEDGRLRWARWRLPCRRAMQRVEGSRAKQREDRGGRQSETEGRVWIKRERESTVSKGE